MAPATQDSQSNFILKNIHITATLDPVYLAGGAIYNKQKLPNGGYDYTYRPYAVRLPKNYDPTKAYAVTFGGGGCGGSASGFASGPGGGLQIDKTQSTIQVGLSYLAGCFDDGGPQIQARSDTPEEPYFRAVLADVESKYCVDKGKVYVSGYSSGAWEAYTLGCAAGDLIRGISGDEGGMRIHRPPCKGPVAAFLSAGTADTTNPIGPTTNTMTSEDSLGSAPGRDDLLLRNGCVSSNYVFTYTDVAGSAPHTQFDTTTYTACVKFTGCPAAYPVVWCPLPGLNHNQSSIGTVQYSPGAAWSIFSSLPTP
jgi:poly(3-hydroxybutyrate) depolymerase